MLDTVHPFVVLICRFAVPEHIIITSAWYVRIHIYLHKSLLMILDTYYNVYLVPIPTCIRLLPIPECLYLYYIMSYRELFLVRREWCSVNDLSERREKVPKQIQFLLVSVLFTSPKHSANTKH